MRPFTDSRSDRVWVERGSIAYSAVTQPSPLPLRQRGTPSVTEAAHSTRVLPNSTRTEPSAWSSQLRVMRTGRSWSSARPSGRGMWCLSDVDDATWGGDAELAVEGRGGLGERTVPVAPWHQVGEHQLADVGAFGVLTRLLAGQVDVRRVVVALEVGRLAQEHVRAARERDQVVADAGVGGVGEGAAAGADAHRVCLDRMVDPRPFHPERPDLHRAVARGGVEVVDRGQ